jgi:hypothetical protein
VIVIGSSFAYRCFTQSPARVILCPRFLGSVGNVNGGNSDDEDCRDHVLDGWAGGTRIGGFRYRST